MDPELKVWIKGNSQEKRNKDFTRYVLQPSTEHEEKEKKVRILTFGDENDLEDKTVLLLGETGAGKTLFLNALLNRIFGVQLEDGLRLHLRDQMDSTKKKVESQTDYTTAYTFYYQEGMPHRYNYTIIDTPGLIDTRGDTQEEVNEKCLRFYLVSDQWVKHLHSVALVWKSSDNRLSRVKKEILGKIKELLDHDIKNITDILMTHTCRPNEAALEVLREGQFDYRDVFSCDSGCLYEILENEDDKKDREVDWGRMTKCLDKFLTTLNESKSVSLEITKHLFQTTAKLTHVKEAIIKLDSQRAELGKKIETYQKEVDQLKQRPLKLDFDKLHDLDMSSKDVRLDDGKHCHYCSKCKKVCNASCSSKHESSQWPPYNDENEGTLDKLFTIGKSFALTVSWEQVKSTIAKIPFFDCLIKEILESGLRFFILLKPNGLTLDLQKMEGLNQCPDCGHKGLDHDVRDKFLFKDASFDVQMELLRLEKYRQVMGKTADFEANLKECMAKLKELDAEKEKEVDIKIDLEIDEELLAAGVMV